MNERELLNKIEHMQYKMDLLYENTEFSRFLYETDITKEQNKNLCDLMDKYSYMISNKEEVYHGTFETEVYRIVPQIQHSYRFCESYAQLCWEDGRWEEVFPALYGDEIKFKHLFK